MGVSLVIFLNILKQSQKENGLLNGKWTDHWGTRSQEGQKPERLKIAVTVLMGLFTKKDMLICIASTLCYLLGLIQRFKLHKLVEKNFWSVKPNQDYVNNMKHESDEQETLQLNILIRFSFVIRNIRIICLGFNRTFQTYSFSLSFVYLLLQWSSIPCT